MSKQKGAKQISWMNLSGSLGGTTFVDSIHGFNAKQKQVISEPRRKYSKDFEVHRVKQHELTQVSKAAKLLRLSLNSALWNAKDKKVVNRVTSAMNQVLKLNGKQRRYKVDSPLYNLDPLLGFDFNEAVRLKAVFNAPCKAVINRTTGDMNISISSFSPNVRIRSPRLATHFIFSAAAVEIDFTKEVFKSDFFESETFACDDINFDGLNILFKLTEGSDSNQLLVLGLQFIDKNLPGNTLLPPHMNPLCIVALDKAPEVLPITIVENNKISE